MKPTGKFNPITKDEILQVEEHDITFWNKSWSELELTEKADFCSFIRAPFLGKQNEEFVKHWYKYYQAKNNDEV